MGEKWLKSGGFQLASVVITALANSPSELLKSGGLMLDTVVLATLVGTTTEARPSTTGRGTGGEGE